jgi:hypothetical protein
MIGFLLLLFLCFLMTQLQRHICVKFKLRIVHRLQSLIMNNGCHIRLDQLLPILCVTFFAFINLDFLNSLLGSIFECISFCVDLDLTQIFDFLFLTQMCRHFELLCC